MKRPAADAGLPDPSCREPDGRPAPRRQSLGKGRAYAPEVVEAARALVEGTVLPMRVVAARVGVSRATVTKLRVRHGWVRPRPARVSLTGRRGGGAAIVPEVVQAAREFLERTPLSYAEVSAWTGISRTTLCRWCLRHGWRRPPEAPAFSPAPRPGGVGRPTRYRTVRGRPYAADAVGEARRLLTGTLLTQAAIAKQIGVSQWWVGDLLRRRGWDRPTVPPGPTGARRFAAARRTGTLAEAGDRRGRPYAASVRAEARALWELTRLPSSLIGARVGAHPVTVARWAREEAWERPRGRLGRAQLRGYFGAVRAGRA